MYCLTMKKTFLAAFAAVLSVLSSNAVQADVKLPAIFGDHMVLQQNQPINVWGWAEAGEAVAVTFGKSSASSKADAEGNWKVQLPAVKADGKAHELSVKGKNEIKLTDILIGEVWVGSGQSNMQWPLNNTHGSKEAIAAANLPNVRLIYVPRVQKPAPEKDFNAAWTTCTPETVPIFSAVLYYFGKKLNEDLDIPIGLIHSSWGGSPIEPWTVKGKTSGNMYNGMIAPLQPFSIKGSIWYQGESNVMRKNGLAYTEKMSDLINGWRKSWNSDLSFHFVQIAPWSGRYEPGQLPALWEAQVATLKLPKTGMAVVTDLVDNIADIHPHHLILRALHLVPTAGHRRPAQAIIAAPFNYLNLWPGQVRACIHPDNPQMLKPARDTHRHRGGHPRSQTNRADIFPVHLVWRRLYLVLSARLSLPLHAHRWALA